MAKEPKAKSPRRKYDWDIIKREFELGQKSYRLLSKEFGPAISTIKERVDKEGWVQDKSEEVVRKTRAALLRENRTAKQHENRTPNTPSREDVDRAVQTNVTVILEHRASVRKGRSLVQLLSGQLNDAITSRDELEEEIETETETAGKDGQPDYKRRNQLMKAVSLPTHAGVLRDLTAAIKNLIPLERQAIGIDNGVPADIPEELSTDVKAALQAGAKLAVERLRNG